MRAALIAILFAGCATQPDGSRIKTGEETQAPQGFIEWCQREPWQKACGGNGAPR